MTKRVSIGIVGPCAAGKTTLITALKKHHIESTHIVQEHSYVKDMWKRFSKPDILIYLDVSYEKTIDRKNLDWSKLEYDAQNERLIHAKSNANIVIDTTSLTKKEVLDIVLNFLKSTSGIDSKNL